MTPGEIQFVEEMGQFLGSIGMTPMAGRMWGFLLICEPPEQTAAQIAEALHASRGAISGTARLLAGPGLIRRMPAEVAQTFVVDGTVRAVVALDGTGKASFTLSGLAIGDHIVIVAYSGDQDYLTGDAFGIKLTVNTGGRQT